MFLLENSRAAFVHVIKTVPLRIEHGVSKGAVEKMVGGERLEKKVIRMSKSRELGNTEAEGFGRECTSEVRDLGVGVVKRRGWQKQRSERQ
jgi:hypothetical protein